MFAIVDGAQLAPLGSLILGIGSILFFILYLRFHAFLALISSALLVALASNRIPIETSMSVVAGGFGSLMANIGILLVFAAIIGKCLMDSGAADRIVRGFTRVFGAEREEYSLLASSFVLAIPVFFDTVFYLLAPLARAVYARRKRDYILLILMAAAGGAVTHALVPPTPGPILVTQQFNEALGPNDPRHISMGLIILVGALAAIVPVALGGILFARYANKHMTVTPQDVMGISQAELEKTALKPDSELPPLWLSLSPIVAPVLLISFTTATEMIAKSPESIQWFESILPVFFDSVHKAALFLGDKSISFMIGALLSIALLVRQKKLSRVDAMKNLEPAIVGGAMISFITCAGGAFGAVLKNAGVGDVIAEASRQYDISMLVMAFMTAALIRIAQGSATVAMATTAGIIGPAIAGMSLPYHPVYLICVIGFGATTTSWMNDSGFWVVCQMSGMTEKETLKTWTVLLTILAVLGFAWTWALTLVLPMRVG